MAEVLAPAGDLERLKWALMYGADAVYIGGINYSLRANANNFTIDELKEAVSFAHNLGKRVYVTVNMLFHNEDLKDVDSYLSELSNIGIDAYIVSDISIIRRIKELNLKPEIHISTQESTVNREAALFWKKLGATRVVLGREASREDIIDIKEATNMELEVFIHGAICTSYSGRCVLSNYVTLRDSNRGGCSQVCRFNFKLNDEDYQIASKDLSMVDFIDDLVKIGVASFKIEGRMRSMYYIATVVNAYKSIVSASINNTLNDDLLRYYKKVLNRVSNRDNTPQFYDKFPGMNEQYYIGRQENSNQDFLAVVKEVNDNIITIEQRNNFKVGDEVEVFGPNTKPTVFKVDDMSDTSGNDRDVANHPEETLFIKTDIKMNANDIIRRPVI